jgi:hypothetical protein
MTVFWGATFSATELVLMARCYPLLRVPLTGEVVDESPTGASISDMHTHPLYGVATGIGTLAYLARARNQRLTVLTHPPVRAGHPSMASSLQKIPAITERFRVRWMNLKHSLETLYGAVPTTARCWAHRIFTID